MNEELAPSSLPDGLSGKDKERVSHYVIDYDLADTYFGALTAMLGRDFSEDSFDVVWCNQAIEHIHPTDAFFRDVDHLLREGVTDLSTGEEIAYAIE